MNEWVVVVDDESVSLTNARRMLEMQGMKVSCMRSGEHLLKFMEKHTPDLILLDIMMPEMDGFETFHALRQQEERLSRTPTPVIFLTGEEDMQMERRGLSEGASDFIRKPFDPDILISRIRKTIKSSKTIETLTEEATIDKLTGFLNKSSGTEKISQILETGNGTLLILDMDNFKLVNDIYGHEMGDRVLEAFAHILRMNIRETDTVSRIGGDEFLVFVDDMNSESAVESFSMRLNALLERDAIKLMGKDHGISLGLSVGAVFVPEYGRDFQLLFRYADSSLYRAKLNGKHGYEVYHALEETGNSENDLRLELGRVTHLVEERGVGTGALLLGPDAFSYNYRFIMRLIKRNRLDATRLLFVLEAKEEGYDLNEAVRAFGELLKEILRKIDIVFQSRPDSFFLLLPELAEKNVPIVLGRILNAWEKTEYHDSVRVLHQSETMSFSE